MKKFGQYRYYKMQVTGPYTAVQKTYNDLEKSLSNMFFDINTGELILVVKARFKIGVKLLRMVLVNYIKLNKWVLKMKGENKNEKEQVIEKSEH